MATTIHLQCPRRISDLAAAAKAGESVSVRTAFEILRVEFLHQANPFQAYVFLGRYSGNIGARLYTFRKCYARGCPNNLCTHVSQAVAIANRYLERDYHVLRSAGIDVEEEFFTLEGMIVRFERLKNNGPLPLTIAELIAMAADKDRGLNVGLVLEIVPSVEHFAHQKNAQTYLSGEFRTCLQDRQVLCYRCFACYATAHESSEKAEAVAIANARLQIIFDQFERAGIICERHMFS